MNDLIAYVDVNIIMRFADVRVRLKLRLGFITPGRRRIVSFYFGMDFFTFFFSAAGFKPSVPPSGLIQGKSLSCFW